VIFVKNGSFGSSNKEASAFDGNTAVVRVQPCKNDTVLYAFTDKGNYIRIYTDAIGLSRLRDKGFNAHALSSLASQDEKIVNAFTVEEGQEDNIVIAHFSSSGNVRYCKLSEFADEKVEYGPAVKLKSDKDRVVSAEIVTDDKIVMFSKKGYALRVDGSDVMIKGKLTLGSSAMKIADDDEMIFAKFMKDDDEILLVNSKIRGKRMIASEISVTNKNCRGSMSFNDLVYVSDSSKEDSLIFDNKEKGVRVVELNDVIITDIYDKGDFLLDEFDYVPEKISIHKLHN
jgi:DNA gyrase/topoisomerase IV subunit A